MQSTHNIPICFLIIYVIIYFCTYLSGYFLGAPRKYVHPGLVLRLDWASCHSLPHVSSLFVLAHPVSCCWTSNCDIQHSSVYNEVPKCLLTYLKETVSRDFLPLGFFVKHLPLGHCFTPLNVFANNIEFTEIFELKVDSVVSLTPLSQKNILTQPPFSSFSSKTEGSGGHPCLDFIWLSL